MARTGVNGPFQVLTCFFGSVGYLGSLQKLETAVSHWSQLLAPGGWLALERWLYPEEFKPGTTLMTLVEGADYKLVRAAASRAAEGVLELDFHYLLARPGQVEHFHEEHRLCMFSHQEYGRALSAAGLDWSYQAQLGMRGMYLGQKC